MPTNALSEVVVLQLTVRAAPQRIGQPGPSGMPIAYHAMNNSVQATVSTSVYGIISAITVQLVLSWTSHEHLIERRTVNDITGLSLDILVAAAIGTLSLTILGAKIPSILILTALSVAWSVTGLLWLGPRLFAEHWFDRAIADYGQSQGNVATGFILAEMADPAHTTGAAAGYGYKQLFYEPFLGGGILTGLSVPLIVSIGSLTIASAAATAGLIICGVVRNRHATLQASR
jgi:ESS family glutamate:Na+ symporter